MARRYEAYKSTVVRPFFRDHFARLDRQIVLVDALAALNAGSAAVADLEQALAAILSSFRLGRTSWLIGLRDAPHRPHPVRRHQGRSPASPRPRPAGSDPPTARRARRRRRAVRRRARRRAGARFGARDARGERDPPRRDAAGDHRHAAPGRDRRGPHVRRRDRDRDLSRRPARRSGGRVQAARQATTASTFASCASARRGWSAPPRA